MIDLEKARRETLRWLILLTLDKARPLGASEGLILSVIAQVPQPVTAHELRREMDYLADRQLISIAGRESPQWHAELTRDGVDVVEYTVPVDPGIARPAKYW
ncbi:hypothetical protein [Arenimonas sp.]|uniref:hypothetical protein n=1 Tax=Arenimonas sp. TaxID=1872635 RepID=UPI0025C41E8B|nr:hypothetical protein [Arenimonas sp.]